MVYSNAFLIFPFNYSLRCGAFWATKSARLGVTVPLAHLKPKIDSALLTGERAGHVTKFSELAALSDCITSLHYFLNLKVFSFFYVLSDFIQCTD